MESSILLEIYNLDLAVLFELNNIKLILELDEQNNDSVKFIFEDDTGKLKKIKDEFDKGIINVNLKDYILKRNEIKRRMTDIRKNKK